MDEKELTYDELESPEFKGEKELTCDELEDDGVLVGTEGPLEGDDHLESLATPQNQVGDLIVAGVVGVTVHGPTQVHLLRLQLAFCKQQHSGQGG